MPKDKPPRSFLTYQYPPGGEPKKPWPDPPPELLDTPEFKAVWESIKTWDINVPGAYHGYCGATGNHVRAILEALKEFLYCPGCGDSIDPYKPVLCAACEEKKEKG